MINRECKFIRGISSIWTSNINIYSKFILLTLIQYWIVYNKCQISYSELSKKSGISERKVQNVIKELEEQQLISIVKSKIDNKTNNVNQYIINEQVVNSYFQDKIFIINNKNNTDKFKKDEKK